MKSNKIAIFGTASNVGKSTIASAIMRHYTNKGLDVVPYKALNITNNIGRTKDDLPIAQSQVIQSKACKKEPDILFNPLLIRPINGRMELYIKGIKQERVLNRALLTDCVAYYNDLASQHELIVIEGSGSCAELNLKDGDIANFPLVKRIKAPVLLVANIEDGGIFASVYGTMLLLKEEERALVKGIIINKFKGNPEGFSEGKQALERIIKRPIIAVVPYVEGGVSLDKLSENFAKSCDMKALDNIISGIMYA